MDTRNWKLKNVNVYLTADVQLWINLLIVFTVTDPHFWWDKKSSEMLGKSQKGWEIFKRENYL